MIMAAGLNLRLRILIPAANSIAGNAFRPVTSCRAGGAKPSKIGNARTPKDGWCWPDALALGDEERPELMAKLCTLTSAPAASRSDLICPRSTTDDDALAADIAAAGLSVGDPRLAPAVLGRL